VWEVRPQDVTAVAADVGDRFVAVVADPATPDERVHRDVATPLRATRAFVVARAPDATDADDRVLAALLAAGVDGRTLQDAVATATGVGRRDAYDRVVRSRSRDR
jgi:hypothetical protein